MTRAERRCGARGSTRAEVTAGLRKEGRFGTDAGTDGKRAVGLNGIQTGTRRRQRLETRRIEMIRDRVSNTEIPLHVREKLLAFTDLLQ